MRLPLLTALALPRPATPYRSTPRRAAPNLASSYLTAPFRILAGLANIYHRSALDAMPVRALTFAIASMFARR